MVYEVLSSVSLLNKSSGNCLKHEHTCLIARRVMNIFNEFPLVVLDRS